MKKSIHYEDKHLLSIYAQLVPETQNRESLPLNSQKEDGGPSESRGQPLLTNTILAFVKAHRLKGELSNLKRLVADRFDPSDVALALKALYDHCSTDLASQGFLFQQRRLSERLFDLVFADIILAFEKLDHIDKIPLIYCEATDLITLPSLMSDPITTHPEKVF